MATHEVNASQDKEGLASHFAKLALSKMPLQGGFPVPSLTPRLRLPAHSNTHGYVRMLVNFRELNGVPVRAYRPLHQWYILSGPRPHCPGVT